MTRNKRISIIVFSIIVALPITIAITGCFNSTEDQENRPNIVYAEEEEIMSHEEMAKTILSNQYEIEVLKARVRKLEEKDSAL